MRVLKLAIVLLLSVSACSKTSENPKASERPAVPPEAEDTPPPPRCAPGVKPLPRRIQRGICVAHNYQASGRRGYGSETAAATLRELDDLGVDWVSLTPFGFMEKLDEPTVHPIGGYRAGETDERMQREIREAKKTGLLVVLKPHIWIVDGKWRGQIAFDDDADWKRWFDSYETWMLHYAEMAEAEGVDVLVIGVELRTSEKRLEKRWRGLIRKIRKRYHGKITYSANWDDASALPWWDAVDYVGVQFYPPLAASPGTEAESVRSKLSDQLDEVEALSERVGKQVLFTEVGFRASDDALVHPHAWPEHAGGVRVDEHTQSMGYEAFIEAVRGRPWVEGVYWWKWFTDPNTTEEGPAGFSPRTKRAETVLRAAYGGNCTPPGDAP